MEPQLFDFTTAKTVTGFTLEQVVAELQKPLPAAAYKPVPGASDLTDIDPAYLTEVATKVFGPIGFGWWYDYAPTDLTVSAEVRTAKSGREYTVFTASLHKLIVRYRLIDATSNTLISEPITATGGNDNEVESYAVRGALTNAIGAAFAKLTWQLPVYKGQLSHRNAATFGENGNGKKSSGKPESGKPSPAKPVAADQLAAAYQILPEWLTRRWAPATGPEWHRGDEGCVVLELKFRGTAPWWMSELTQVLGLERAGYSKYVAAVTQALGEDQLADRAAVPSWEE